MRGSNKSAQLAELDRGLLGADRVQRAALQPAEAGLHPGALGMRGCASRGGVGGDEGGGG